MLAGGRQEQPDDAEIAPVFAYDKEGQAIL